MPGAGISRVLAILGSLYPHVQTLEEFAETLVYREGHKVVLIEQPDTNLFVSFVRGMLICSDKKIEDVPSCSQICTLHELLALVLNNLKRKKKRNVLANGYNYPFLAQDRDADPFKFHGEVTQNAAYVHGSDLWKRIAQRLGTDVMHHLLENCAIFVAVPPSCMFQVCGVPVYDRVSMGSAAGLHLQNRSRRNTRANRTATWHRTRQDPILSERRRRRRDGGGDIRKRKREKVSEREDSLPGKRRRVDGFTEDSNQVSNGTGNEQQSANMKATKSKNTNTTLEGGPSWSSGLLPPLPPSQCFIRTHSMLYGGRGMHGFLLNKRRKGGAEGPKRLQGRDLLRVVFFEGAAYLNGREKKPKKFPLRFFNMVPLFSQLMRRHRRCPYTKILQRVCPRMGDRDGVGVMAILLPQHCAPHRVYLFVKECLSTVVPQELWGSDQNRLNFLSRVRGFLCMGKFERLSLAELMWKISVNDCDWLKISKTGRCPPSELAYRTRVLGQFLAWLLDGYVLGLVRALFYVTECMGQKNALRFYRQEVWAKLQDLAFRGHILKGQVEELTPAQVASLPKTTVISRLRFIPKTKNMRPITRLIGADSKTRLFQSHVRTLLDVLRACTRSEPSLLGSTVWGMTDIHRVLRSFAPSQKDQPQPLYFVKVDVSGAYDSLPHSRLLQVISEALSPVQKKLFSVRTYAKVWSTHEGLKKTFIRQADFLDVTVASKNMKGFLMSLQREGKVHDAILVEQYFSTDVLGKDVLEFFTQMLTGSVVSFGKKTFRQCCGIPQGSVVSSLLCCLCYGHMEKVLFRNVTEKGGCLMRLIDDFLLITPDLNQAQTFLKTLMAGVPQYGIVVNAQKVAVNFPVKGDEGSCPWIRLLPPHCLFPWCGLLLDTHSLDVYNNYSSYAGLSLRYSLTLGSTHSAGQQMKRKLMSILKLKCHALFLDHHINSMEAVYKNIYELVLLQACRFHTCAQSLPFGQKVAKNPDYFLHMIWDMAEYTNQLIRLCNKGVALVSKAQTDCLQYEAVELLYCLSFLLVLGRHRPLYKDLLLPLLTRKRCLERKLGCIRLARVRQAATPKIPEDFKAIQT